MNVLLINPPRFNELVGNNPAIIETHRGYNPPLGILSLAGYLEDNSSHEVEILDAQPLELTYAELAEVLLRKSPDVVGITAMTFTLTDVMRTVRLVKELHPNAKLVLGGPHVHIYPNETIDLPGVDFLVQGEGEIAFLKLLEHLHDPEVQEQIGGMVFKRGNKIINTGIAPASENLDELGFPARHLIDVNQYTSLLGKDDVITTMFTSRGCPYRCTFCMERAKSGYQWRSYSSERAVEELARDQFDHFGEHAVAHLLRLVAQLFDRAAFLVTHRKDAVAGQFFVERGDHERLVP